jgi:hypothetical protein
MPNITLKTCSALVIFGLAACATDPTDPKDESGDTTPIPYVGCTITCRYVCDAPASANTHMDTGPNSGSECLVSLGACQGGFPEYNWSNWSLESKIVTCPTKPAPSQPTPTTTAQ